MKFFLTSSGLTNDALASALETLVGKPLRETSLLFVPTAGNTSVDDKNWLINNLVQFQKYQFKSIAMIDIAIPKETWAPHFANIDVVCFGGGNEKYLARVMQEQGMKDFLPQCASLKVYMGISAGSMVAGHFLAGGLTNELFPEEDYGKQEGVPMKLLDLIFVPHMNSDWFKQVRPEYLETLKPKFDRDTYATDDDTALAIDGEKIDIVGGGKSWRN